MRPGAGKKGSLRMVWKMGAGIEDGLDNARPLIREDARSLSVSSESFSAPCSVRRTEMAMKSGRILRAYLWLR